MPIPEPFTIVSLAAGVTANIATGILKHHAQSLESTLVGRMLKRAGLINSNFDERLREVLIEALNLYFQTHSQYRLNGIISFFRDPSTSTLIADHILDRKPIDQEQIRQALDKHLGNRFVTRALIQERGLKLERIIPDFLECYRRVLGKQLDTPQIALLLEIVDQSNAVIEEMRASEERLKVVTQQVAEQITDQTNLLERIAADQQIIKTRLGIDRPLTSITEEIKIALDAAPRGGMFEAGGLCSGYLLQPRPSHYFVAQEFNPNRDDLRFALANALEEFGVQPICADDFLWAGHILCKISALIQSTPFGVYQMTVGQNRNVYLELGIAIGLGRPFVLVKDKDAQVSPLLQGLENYPIDSYLELRYGLGQKVRPFLANIARYRPQSLPPAGSQRTVIIAHGGLDVIDFCVAVSKVVAAYNLTPVILGDPTGRLAHYLELEKLPHTIISSTGGIQLDEALEAIQAARLGMYHIENAAAPDTFLALGISMGLTRPGILVHNANSDPPSDVKGLGALKFTSYSNLEQSLPQKFGPLLRRYS